MQKPTKTLKGITPILIAAVGRNGALGANGVLPWRCPTDLRHFRDLTIGKVLLMGRKTADSLPKALRDRINVVMTRDRGYARKGFTVVHDMRGLRRVLARCGTEEVWVIGGGEIYAKFLPYTNLVHLTQLDIDVPDADTWFPMDGLARFNATMSQSSTDPLVHFWVFSPKPQTLRARSGICVAMALNEPVAMWAPGVGYRIPGY